MWTVKNCFVGESCWCGIIISPEGEECNYYGEVSREDCVFIIDALNNNLEAKNNINADHPVPWYNSRTAIVTTQGLKDKDNVEHAISCCGGVKNPFIDIFVEAVNSFYNY